MYLPPWELADPTKDVNLCFWGAWVLKAWWLHQETTTFAVLKAHFLQITSAMIWTLFPAWTLSTGERCHFECCGSFSSRLIRQESISKSLPLFSMSAITLSLCSLKVTVLTWTRLIHHWLMHVWIIWVHPAAKPQCRGPGSAQCRMCWKPSAVEVSFCWKVQACMDRNTSRLKYFLVM